MNRFLKTGLVMQLIQFITLGCVIVIYTLLTLPWTLNLLLLSILALFNVASIIFMAIGIIKALIWEDNDN